MGQVNMEIDADNNVYLAYTFQDRIEKYDAAEEAGLQAGDIVLEINRTSCEDYGQRQLSDLFENDGDVVKLTILRGEEKLNKQVRLRRLL